MSMLALILAISAVVWYFVDRVKGAWCDLSWGKYITMVLAAALGAAAVFTYGLDLLVALAVTQELTVVGEIFTVLAIMSGSSAISEIIAKIKK